MAEKRRTIKKAPAKEAPKKENKKEVKETPEKLLMANSTKKSIIAVLISAITLLLLLAIYGTSLSHVGEESSRLGLSGDSVIGVLGVGIKWVCLGLLGNGAYVIPILLLGAAVFMFKTKNIPQSKSYVYVSGVIFALCISALFFVFSSGRETFSIADFWFNGALSMGGGILGGLIGWPLYYLTRLTGSLIILLALMLISFIAMTDFNITKFIAKKVREAKAESKKKDEKEPEEAEIPVYTSDPLPTKEPIRRIKRTGHTDAATDIVDDYTPLSKAVEELPRTGEVKEADIKIFAPKTEEKISGLEENAVVVDAPKRMKGEIPVEIEREQKVIPYTFPDTNLLNKKLPSASDTSPAALRELSAKLVETLKSFGIEVKVLEISKGPAITRFELQPTAGVRVSKITSLADDIALSLAATSVRIEAPIPGKSAIGIELPNQSIATVTIRDVLESKEFKESPSLLSCALGRDIAGKSIVGDIAKMPHVLIAGATGSGKSVCINSLIASILYKASPNDVKLIMIDPKVVELNVYNGIPHLLIPVVTDPRKAAGALNWAVQEMTTRYRYFADNGVRDLKGYNKLMEEKGQPRLPQIVIIIDELADLMMVAPKDVESYVCRLAQLARAAGMHLVIATQRPSVDVITGVIKANIPSRIAFAVSSYVDSRTILDTAGAEKLLGKGDMLFFPMGASKPTRVQGAFISDEEVEAIVSFVKKTSEAEYDEDVLEQLEKAGQEGGKVEEAEADAKEADPLLEKAIEEVIAAGQASVSLVQRRLSVGYSRAGRLIDQMEERGVIGPHEGSKPRAVLMTREEYMHNKMILEQGEVIEEETEIDPYPSIDVEIPSPEEDGDDFIFPQGE